MSILSSLFQRGSDGTETEEMRRTIKDQAKTIEGLQRELSTLRLKSNQAAPLPKVWVSGPPPRPFNDAAIGLPCRWLTPALREIPQELYRSFDVHSFSLDSDAVYQVDLAAHTCTCPDFAKRRASLPEGHALRCCKHIFHILRECGLMEGQDDLVCHLLSDPPDPSQRLLEVDFPHGKVVLGLTPGREWVDVFAPKKVGKTVGPVEKFGYDQAGKRWSYSKPPFNPVPIKETINVLVCGRSFA